MPLGRLTIFKVAVSVLSPGGSDDHSSRSASPALSGTTVQPALHDTAARNDGSIGGSKVNTTSVTAGEGTDAALWTVIVIVTSVPTLPAIVRAGVAPFVAVSRQAGSVDRGLGQGTSVSAVFQSTAARLGLRVAGTEVTDGDGEGRTGDGPTETGAAVGDAPLDA